MTPMRIEPAAPRSRVNHFTTEPLRPKEVKTNIEISPFDLTHTADLWVRLKSDIEIEQINLLLAHMSLIEIVGCPPSVRRASCVVNHCFERHLLLNHLLDLTKLGRFGPYMALFNDCLSGSGPLLI